MCAQSCHPGIHRCGGLDLLPNLVTVSGPSTGTRPRVWGSRLVSLCGPSWCSALGCPVSFGLFAFRGLTLSNSARQSSAGWLLFGLRLRLIVWLVGFRDPDSFVEYKGGCLVSCPPHTSGCSSNNCDKGSVGRFSCSTAWAYRLPLMLDPPEQDVVSRYISLRGPQKVRDGIPVIGQTRLGQLLRRPSRCFSKASRRARW